MCRGLFEEGCEKLFVKIIKLAIRTDKDFILKGNGLENLSDVFGVTDECCASIRNRVRRQNG